MKLSTGVIVLLLALAWATVILLLWVNGVAVPYMG
jgi:hypothetical protein